MGGAKRYHRLVCNANGFREKLNPPCGLIWPQPSLDPDSRCLENVSPEPLCDILNRRRLLPALLDAKRPVYGGTNDRPGCDPAFGGDFDARSRQDGEIAV